MGRDSDGTPARPLCSSALPSLGAPGGWFSGDHRSYRGTTDGPLGPDSACVYAGVLIGRVLGRVSQITMGPLDFHGLRGLLRGIATGLALGYGRIVLSTYSLLWRGSKSFLLTRSISSGTSDSFVARSSARRPPGRLHRSRSLAFAPSGLVLLAIAPSRVSQEIATPTGPAVPGAE